VIRTQVAVVLVAGVSAAVLLAGCGSASGPTGPTIEPARTYQLAGFTAGPRPVAGKPFRLSFAIGQPSGAVLTHFRHGGGPHTGVHLIVVRSDLGVLIHRHPPIAVDGRIRQTLVLPTAGRYRVVVDAYPGSGTQRNLQLFRWLNVSGAGRPGGSLPAPRGSVAVDGYRFTLRRRPRLRAVEASFLTITVTRPDGTPATFTPWYGALAHAIFFRTGTLDYFHTHVCSSGASGCTAVLGSAKVTGHSSKPGELTVGVLVPVAGTWRLFLQTKTDGRVLTAPFTLDVR
jgi:hypothetical protein